MGLALFVNHKRRDSGYALQASVDSEYKLDAQVFKLRYSNHIPEGFEPIAGDKRSAITGLSRSQS